MPCIPVNFKLESFLGNVHQTAGYEFHTKIRVEHFCVIKTDLIDGNSGACYFFIP